MLAVLATGLGLACRAGLREVGARLKEIPGPPGWRLGARLKTSHRKTTCHELPTRSLGTGQKPLKSLFNTHTKCKVFCKHFVLSTSLFGTCKLYF